MRKIVFLLLMILCVSSFAAVTELTQFESQAQRQQFVNLTKQLRCLVCQNEDLYDSNAKLAADLRRQVAQKIRQGQTDAQIKAYLVARYGDFVLYSPTFNQTNLLLWFGPFAFLLIGVWWLLRTIVKQTKEDSA